ncbi:MAG TPA: bifunctional DNA-formamidopyrimidine glycosylase/DNA-(apurinic or apyrimidinic site) lyase [Marinospirillum sp.]|uniref:bifunctional DNA-formamidopyrimidine glycosylase/DNA-(apurinic or apyrimidinic site) lyase n=1 Tax=Marinospirillum sp. TaxID=2183934 RepID=UPI002B48F2EC|nr:bifunctional DNA-formamidopyrimidine glycosylase/DNA-(apurinic or apyrimidinic site) lyase [Marinospirillum sp.]HKM14715.1 bifunctional DNA-formamidopyrimidine glycosylase/DNA-(apurinic or apyrimidinic site) lyase [Marinospirillum sp.]
MPELPEVETTRKGITPWLEGRVIEKLDIRQPKLRWPIPDDLAQRLVGLTLAPLQRRAKYLIFPVLENNGQEANWGFLWHLGMSGSLRLVTADEPWKKHDHVELTVAALPSDTEVPLRLRYHDPRRFGALLDYQGAAFEHSLLKKLGPEPLSAAFTAQALFQRSRNRKLAIKVFIMDNAQVVGVGNIYASEALFRAGIDPRSAAGTVSLKRYQRLVEIIRDVLAAAIEQGGTTLRDFVGGDGKPGYFAQQLDVYGRNGLPCKVCSTVLQEVKLGQRSSVWCATCQA